MGRTLLGWVVAASSVLASVVVPEATASAVLPAPLTAAYFEAPFGSWVSFSRTEFAGNIDVATFGPDIVSFSLLTNVHSYTLTFAAPQGEPLAVGTYEHAQRAPTRQPGHPGIELYGDGRACDTVSGRFIVDQIELLPSGEPSVFSARFEHFCNAEDEPVFGAISFNATADYRMRWLSGGEVNFAQPYGVPSQPVTLTVNNMGPSTLAVSAVTTTGPDATEFEITDNGCAGAVLAANQSCPVSVRFAPGESLDDRLGFLTVFDDVSPPGGAGWKVKLTGSVRSSEGEFTAITPQRILDTRNGIGGFSRGLGRGETYSVDVTGVGGVPADGVSAVVMNATATNATTPTFVTVWPSGEPQPDNSNLNVGAGQTAPNLVTVAVGADGDVNVFNANGTTDVIFDVVGFYSDAGGRAGARFRAINPMRLFDTRDGWGGAIRVGPIGPDDSVVYNPKQSGWVPHDATAIVMNVTVTEPSANGFLTVSPDDVERPITSNLNFGPGRTVPNLVTVRLPSDGALDFYNAFGSTHVIADLVGYYVPPPASGEQGRFIGLTPARLLDTREVDPPLPLGPDEFGVLSVAGFGGVPHSGAAAAVLNVTVTGTTSAGFVSAFPDDACDIPAVSNLNFGPAQTIPNLAIVRLSTLSGCAVEAGAVDIYNSHGQTHVIVDVFGYFTS